MLSLSQAPPLGDLPSPHGAFQGHAAHTMRWPMMLSPKGSVGACIPTGVFAFLPCAFAAHEDDVVQDVDAEKLPGLHQAPGQGAVFLARLGCPRWMVMTAHERGGIAEDGG